VRVDTRPGTEQSDEPASEQLVAENRVAGRQVACHHEFRFLLWKALAGSSSGLLISLALLIAALSMWTARRITRPISAFAAAAERFGASSEAIPLPESGPRGTARAATPHLPIRCRNACAALSAIGR